MNLSQFLLLTLLAHALPLAASASVIDIHREFKSCDIDGDGLIAGHEEVQSLRRLAATGANDLHRPRRTLLDPIVSSNVLFFVGGGMWRMRADSTALAILRSWCTRQAFLLSFCGLASVWCECMRASFRFHRTTCVFSLALPYLLRVQLP
eukprot:SAG11_NODE_257_length_11556_cov_8.547176_6_plen_150_part_00